MWVFNVFLYLCFLFNKPAYESLLNQGAECYAYIAAWGDEDSSQPPPCFYLGEKYCLPLQG